jgi:hypothetical protein
MGVRAPTPKLLTPARRGRPARRGQALSSWFTTNGVRAKSMAGFGDR